MNSQIAASVGGAFLLTARNMTKNSLYGRVPCDCVRPAAGADPDKRETPRAGTCLRAPGSGSAAGRRVGPSGRRVGGSAMCFKAEAGGGCRLDSRLPRGARRSWRRGPEPEPCRVNNRSVRIRVRTMRAGLPPRRSAPREAWPGGLRRSATVQHVSARPRGTVSSLNTRVNFITERPVSLYAVNLRHCLLTCELYSSLFILNREHDERSNTCVGTQSECCGVPHIISISFDLVFDDPPAPRAVGAVVGTCMQGSAAPAPRPLVRSQHAIRVHHPSIYCCDHRGQRLDSSNVVMR